MVFLLLVGAGCLHDVGRFHPPGDAPQSVDLHVDMLIDAPGVVFDASPRVEQDVGGPDSVGVCSDSTLPGRCSSTKPLYCDAGILLDRCAGPDGLPGTADDCGCPTGATCLWDGTCCAPNCSGKSCGDDGCGGSCGTCSGFPCAGNTPICKNGSCAACECPNYCYNIVGYCGAQGGVLKDCYYMTPTVTNTNYCICTVHCANGSPPDLDIGDSRNPGNGGC